MQLYNTPPRQSFMPVVIPDDSPVYRIKEGKFFADDELYEPGSVIIWHEEPNLEMEPLNEMARDNMRAYIEKLDTHGRAAAQAAGKAYVSLASAFENAHALAKQEGRRVELLNGTQEVPIMGGKRRSAPKAQKVDLTPAAPVVSSKNKHSLDTAKMINDMVGKQM